MRKFDLVFLTLGLFAAAFPSLVPPVLGIVTAAAGALLATFAWAFAHLSLVCGVAAGCVLSLHPPPGQVGESYYQALLAG
ncbi:hypothetical protein ADL21_03580 [Streptomyces albus subsp. albus]|nr:hypothetical protein ADL21_03580 [Streptomyces albus subsp. albus]